MSKNQLSGSWAAETTSRGAQPRKDWRTDVLILSEDALCVEPAEGSPDLPSPPLSSASASVKAPLRRSLFRV